MRIFLGLCGSVRNGYDSSSRGEGRWALSLARCLKDYDHEIIMAPDMEPCDWGTCKKPDNILMIQPGQKHLLEDKHFDIAIFTSWQTAKPEAQNIHADKYAWGVMGWKHEIMKDGFFEPNEYVIRWTRHDLNEIPYPINFRDRCFLLAQPFGKEFGQSKFNNNRLAWVAKEAFLDSTHTSFIEAAVKHMKATINVCKNTGCGLSIFSSGELNPSVSRAVKEEGILDELQKLPNVTMYPSLSYTEFSRELRKCSVTIPICFAGSTQESIFNGLVPMMYKDGVLSNHPWTTGAIFDLTKDKNSRFQSENERNSVLKQGEIEDILSELVTNKRVFEQYLHRLRPMVVDSLDDHVNSQLYEIMEHKS